MKTPRQLLLISALLAVINTAQAQTAATPAAAPAPTVSKDCKGLKPQAQQECLKVAKKMEHDAAAPHDPATTAAQSSGPSADTVHHSSPVMQTQEEKNAAARSTKAGHDAAKTPPSSDSNAPPK